MAHRYTDSERQFARDYGRTKLDELRGEGVTRVQILGAGDGNVCSACAALDGKIFLLGDVPILPIHEETEDTWYICRCIYMPAREGDRLSPRKLPRIAVTGLESLALAGMALTNARRRVIDRLRETRCGEHGQVPSAVNVEPADGGRAKVTVAACCAKLLERAYVEIAIAIGRGNRR
jgi:hypothetical protein